MAYNAERFLQHFGRYSESQRFLTSIWSVTFRKRRQKWSLGIDRVGRCEEGGPRERSAWREMVLRGMSRNRVHSFVEAWTLWEKNRRFHHVCFPQPKTGGVRVPRWVRRVRVCSVAPNRTPKAWRPRRRWEAERRPDLVGWAAAQCCRRHDPHRNNII